MSPAGRRNAASSRCAISARFWSALDGAAGGGGGAARSGARTGAGLAASLALPCRFASSAARGALRVRCARLRATASVRRAVRDAVPGGRQEDCRADCRADCQGDCQAAPARNRPTDRCVARHSASAGRRTSSANEGRTGRGGGSGICGSGSSKVSERGPSPSVQPPGSDIGAIRGCGSRTGPGRQLVASGLGAHDIGFDDDIGGAADHQQMFDVVAAHQHQPPAAVDGGGIDHRQPRHPSAIGVGAEAVAGKSPDQPGRDADQRQNGDECEEECESLHALVPGK